MAFNLCCLNEAYKASECIKSVETEFFGSKTRPLGWFCGGHSFFSFFGRKVSQDLYSYGNCVFLHISGTGYRGFSSIFCRPSGNRYSLLEILELD